MQNERFELTFALRVVLHFVEVVDVLPRHAARAARRRTIRRPRRLRAVDRRVVSLALERLLYLADLLKPVCSRHVKRALHARGGIGGELLLDLREDEMRLVVVDAERLRHTADAVHNCQGL